MQAPENANMSDFDMSNISISRPFMTGKYEQSGFGNRKLIYNFNAYLFKYFIAKFRVVIVHFQHKI